MYRHLGLNYIPVELRENMGEIEAAESADFADLVLPGDYRGVLHCHSTASDGNNSIEALVEHAHGLGHEYLGITDHSRSSFQANGLSDERLAAQIDRICELRKSVPDGFTLLSSIECDIHTDGTLDYDDALLDRLDYVIVSVHNAFSRPRDEQTARVIKAIEHPASRILAHPTGRLLLRRDEYEIDLEKVIDAAIANGVAIELNCQPMRMDMDWRLWRRARDKGLVCSINPDAHKLVHFDLIDTGMHFCRKGWLTADDILNCWDIERVRAFFR
jgi:DNA polymerase (family 10)